MNLLSATNWALDQTSAPGWHDWVAFGLTLVGFAFAFWQLHKTRSASEEAASELAAARLKLNTDQLAAVITQLSTVCHDMDFAILANDREVAHRTLLRYSYVATEAVALLGNLEDDHAVLVARISKVSVTALDKKGEIVSHSNPDINRLTKAVTREIGAITVELSGLTAKDRYKIRQSNV